ncbi:MAG: bifunctional ornithine acetyltransferase/N-acetylglutamate synthase, partial [Thermoanaerobaculia bacterium]
ARFSLKKISLHAGPIALVINGGPAPYAETDAAKVFTRERVPLRIDLGSGNARAVVLSSDLGHDYVSLNADYRS